MWGAVDVQQGSPPPTVLSGTLVRASSAAWSKSSCRGGGVRGGVGVGGGRHVNEWVSRACGEVGVLRNGARGDASKSERSRRCNTTQRKSFVRGGVGARGSLLPPARICTDLLPAPVYRFVLYSRSRDMPRTCRPMTGKALGRGCRKECRSLPGWSLICLRCIEEPRPLARSLAVVRP